LCARAESEEREGCDQEVAYHLFTRVRERKSGPCGRGSWRGVPRR
jgi:hypothetical protein